MVLTITVPARLAGHTLLWVYDRGDLGQVICGPGEIGAASLTMKCSIPKAGCYVLRIYTDDSKVHFDDVNP